MRQIFHNDIQVFILTFKVSYWHSKFRANVSAGDTDLYHIAI